MPVLFQAGKWKTEHKCSSSMELDWKSSCRKTGNRPSASGSMWNLYGNPLPVDRKWAVVRGCWAGYPLPVRRKWAGNPLPARRKWAGNPLPVRRKWAVDRASWLGIPLPVSRKWATYGFPKMGHFRFPENGPNPVSPKCDIEPALGYLQGLSDSVVRLRILILKIASLSLIHI